MKGYKVGEILSNEHVGENVYKMVVKGQFQGKPGQFYMLRNWENDPILSRPLGLCDLTDDTITFLYMVFGRGTNNFSELKPGVNIKILGPLGNGFTLVENKRVAILSGAVGIAPMYYLAKNLNCKIDLYAGFRDFEFFADEFTDLVDNIYISSDNGKTGFHGNVLELFKETNKKYDFIYACGPNPMLRAICNELESNKVEVSLESHMACGFGVCLGCSIETTKGMKKVCHDGPVFNGDEVIFND